MNARPSAGGCPFCAIAEGQAPAVVVRRWPDALAIAPLRPVTTAGHVLVLPIRHVADFTTDPEVSAAVMRRAAELAARPCNLIANVGPETSASVEHLHLHVVPRRSGDGLVMPWDQPPGPAEDHLQPTITTIASSLSSRPC
ncbi:HIT family protein [Kitasatospora sp. NPDC088783]|uniref:HIT family protein n=1 Tax=Kitasatospora sp. NPDC088783 TaxID=3364077 RepID=UPI00380B7D26